jgi:CelD/BcsL family acetyltransferase involved in cellulose biosynthesis
VVDQLSAQLIIEEHPPAQCIAKRTETFEAAAEAGDYRVEVVRDRTALEALAPEWNRAVAEAGIEHPFLSHKWISTWWDSFGAGTDLHVILVRRGGVLVGVAPLLRGEERLYGMRLRCLHSPYNPHVPRCGFIAAAGQPEAVYRAIWQHLRDTGDQWDLLKLSQVPAESEPMRRLPPLAEADGYIAAVWRGERSPYLVIDQDWDRYERQLGRAHRRNIHNRLNRLAKLGEVKLEVISGAEGLDEFLNEGFRIEAAAWKGRSGTAIVSQPEVERFYRTLAADAAAQGRLGLYFLTVDGRRVAFSFALCQGNRIYSLKVGYDPAFRRYSPSTLQCYLELHRAFHSGIAEFDFLGNDDVWKLQWSSRVRPHDWLFVFAPRWRGRLAAWIKFQGLPRLRQWRLYNLLRRMRERIRQEPAPANDD